MCACGYARVCVWEILGAMLGIHRSSTSFPQNIKHYHYIIILVHTGMWNVLKCVYLHVTYWDPWPHTHTLYNRKYSILWMLEINSGSSSVRPCNIWMWELIAGCPLNPFVVTQLPESVCWRALTLDLCCVLVDQKCLYLSRQQAPGWAVQLCLYTHNTSSIPGV